MAIITISRQMGSDGASIAQKVADTLNYKLINHETILEAASEHGLTPEAIEKADEKPPPFVDKQDHYIEISSQRIQLIILEYALKGNIVIYGRGGQDLLPGIPHAMYFAPGSSPRLKTGWNAGRNVSGWIPTWPGFGCAKAISSGPALSATIMIGTGMNPCITTSPSIPAACLRLKL